MALTITVKIDEPVQIGRAVVRVVSSTKNQVRLCIEAPRDVEINRSNHMFPEGYGAELQANGRWLLCGPNEDTGRAMAVTHSSHGTRDEALAKAKELTDG